MMATIASEFEDLVTYRILISDNQSYTELGPDRPILHLSTGIVLGETHWDPIPASDGQFDACSFT